VKSGTHVKGQRANSKEAMAKKLKNIFMGIAEGWLSWKILPKNVQT
jgi:hypothetical protein